MELAEDRSRINTIGDECGVTEKKDNRWGCCFREEERTPNVEDKRWVNG
jgi:hypothetical protein